MCVLHDLLTLAFDETLSHVFWLNTDKITSVNDDSFAWSSNYKLFNLNRQLTNVDFSVLVFDLHAPLVTEEFVLKPTQSFY